MKAKYLLLVPVILMLTALKGLTQDINDIKPSVKDIIPFGKKLPPPDLTSHSDKFMPQMTSTGINTKLLPGIHKPDINAMKKDLNAYKQHLMKERKEKISRYQLNSANAIQSPASSLNSNFHLTKDINALAESNPLNKRILNIDISDGFYNDSTSYAVLDNVAYFVADDGIHGNELWRSDGTEPGTYMVIDLEPGAASPILYDITAVNGKIYFSGYASAYGPGVFISDGTQSGTQLLINVNNPTKYIAMGKEVYFIADGDFSFLGAIWKTDGTTTGTTRVLNIGDQMFGGEQIYQPTFVNDLLFFTFLNYETFSWELWRTDGTDAGTYHVGPDYPALDLETFQFTNYAPAQLTNYNNKIYFSANDGTGRKLWVSDGTDAGTTTAPNNNDVIVDADYLGTSFPMLNNVLYIPGEEPSKGNGLYKYDASDAAGLVKIKDFAPVGEPAFIVPREMKVVNNTLYFKVTNYTSGIHDELWSSGGESISTTPVQKLSPGETISNIYNGSGVCYFVKLDKDHGTELWRTIEKHSGTSPIMVSDIFKGPTSSYPAYLTAFKGNLIFGAADEKRGYELFMTRGNAFSANLVKDINTSSTPSSNAGFNFYNYLGYRSMAALGNDVLFNAYERVHGYELYKSDGTAKGTDLLNDIIPGEEGAQFVSMISKNNAVYFSTTPQSGTDHFIYKSNGTNGGLAKIVTDNVFIISFNVAENGLVFYTHYNYSTAMYELWRSDGTIAGTFLLSSTLNYTNYLNVIGNKAFFGAGDAMHGYELWTSDGSVSGTRLVKDINPGVDNSSPAGMAVYKNEVYFAANNGSGPSFWKSDGTEAGTIQLAQIDPWYSSTVLATEKTYFEVSNDILYFSAIDYSNSKGTQLWKTDGTAAGTRPVKDISPNSSSFYPIPSYFTDVNGTLFFIGNDGLEGTELWKTDGTENGTQLVKDITPGINGSNMNHLTSFAGKLYFANAENKDGFNRYYLWSSDGTNEGTNEVGGFGNSNIAAVLAAGDNLFLTVYTTQYGAELYAGKADKQTGQFVSSRMTNITDKTSMPFNAVVYPNPGISNITLQITGDLKNDVSVSISDMSGKKLWQINSSKATLIHLPTEKYAAGIYIVTVTSGIENKTIRLVKQ